MAKFEACFFTECIRFETLEWETFIELNQNPQSIVVMGARTVSLHCPPLFPGFACDGPQELVFVELRYFSISILQVWFLLLAVEGNL